MNMLSNGNVTKDEINSLDLIKMFIFTISLLIYNMKQTPYLRCIYGSNEDYIFAGN